ncbi:MAG: N-acetylmuramoyl-L-alanine amidase [Acidobacteria bacterium]|nr:N-acetylmuramoyl-L-alanine amidase [Acidobacteriota bacterium]
MATVLPHQVLGAAAASDSRASSHFKIVESYARFFARPEVRLRFLNKTLALQAERSARMEEALGRWAMLRKYGLFERFLDFSLYTLIFREVSLLLPADAGGKHGLLGLCKQAPLSSRIFFRCYQLRRPLYVVSAFVLLAFCFAAYRGAAWTVARANDYLAGRYKSVERIYAGGDEKVAAGLSEHLPSYQPEKVWLVEQGADFERYSNGARIINTFETANRPRRYLVYKPGGTEAEGQPQTAPVGIVYHTSESVLLPFVAGNSGSIEFRSKNLLAYVRDKKSYNYVIDRFGQIYRVVRDEDAAFHAGNSVWSDGRAAYTGLNESFLGVCFETKADVAEGGEQLTEAQVLAGRLLTQVLRSRYQIDDANCTVHGLVSVNPSNGRIAFHHDWARNFPFEAMGLSDKYAVAPASVAELGFGYDPELVSLLGGRMWPGVAAGEEEFARRAEGQGTKPEELRGRMQKVYRERMDAQRAVLRAEKLEERESSTAESNDPES